MLELEAPSNHGWPAWDGRGRFHGFYHTCEDAREAGARYLRGGVLGLVWDLNTKGQGEGGDYAHISTYAIVHGLPREKY